MNHPYDELVPEYERLLASMKVTRAKAVDAEARKLLTPGIFDHHQALEDKTGVPAIFAATLFEREASSNFRLALGQGDPWNKISTHVPRGQGPFSSWEAAGVFYVNSHKLNVFSAPLSMAYLCWKGEAWNGFGPRAHGRFTGYLWSGTNHYDPPTGKGGKYVSDGQWSPGTVDQQLGIVPVMARMIELRPTLDDRFAIQFSPMTPAPEHAMAVPVGVGGGDRDAKWIQAALNKIGHRPVLNEDGDYGKLTRAAVRVFQDTHGLRTDGFAGEQTIKALETALEKID